MPELPEVETVVRDLRPLLTGRRITGVRQSEHKLRHPWDAKTNLLVLGAKFTGVRRRGKWITVDLDTPNPLGPPSDHAVLSVHLGMTGQFTVVNRDEPQPTHLHLVFELDNRQELRFRDQRRFGSVDYVSSAAGHDFTLDTFLGPEPFDLDPTEFHERLSFTKQNLKAILLNQAYVAGVGNIYADEACFGAKLRPTRTGNSLTPGECERLCEAITTVLTRAIESRGSTIRNYVGGSGLRGGFQNEFAVYGRTGEPCLICATPIACMRLAGRSTHYCPLCQPANPQMVTQKPSAHPRIHKGK